MDPPGARRYRFAGRAETRPIEHDRPVLPRQPLHPRRHGPAPITVRGAGSVSTPRATGAPDFGAAAYRTGEVPVVVHGVRDAQHLAALVALVERVPGVVRVVATDGAAEGDRLLTVRLSRPTPLSSEIRGRLGRGLVSCTTVGARIEVVLAGTGRDAADTVAWPPAPAGRRTPGTPSRPWSHAPGAPAWSADVPAPAPPPPSADAPAGLTGAFDAEDDLSILIFDRDLRVRTTFGGLHARSARLPASVVGMTLREIARPGDYDGLVRAAHAALGGTPGTLEIHSGSSDRTYDATLSPLREDGEVRGVLIILRDVTQRHADEALLAELTEVFELTFDHSPAGQGLLSPDGRWLRVNDPLRRLLGRSEDALVGRRVQDVTHPADVDHEQGLLYEVAAGRSRGYELVKRFVHGGGEPVRAYVRMSAVPAPDGAVRGLIAHVVDADRWDDDEVAS